MDVGRGVVVAVTMTVGVTVTVAVFVAATVAETVPVTVPVVVPVTVAVTRGRGGLGVGPEGRLADFCLGPQGLHLAA